MMKSFLTVQNHQSLITNYCVKIVYQLEDVCTTIKSITQPTVIGKCYFSLLHEISKKNVEIIITMRK